MILLHIGDHLSQATTFWDLFAFWDVEIVALVTLLIIFAAYVIGFSRLRLEADIVWYLLLTSCSFP